MNTTTKDAHRSKRNTEWRVAAWVLGQLRNSYSFYMASAIVFALVSLAPGKLFHYFTSQLSLFGQQTLANAFLQQVLLFGGLIALATAATVFLKTFFKERLRLELESFLRREVVERLHTLPSGALRGVQRGEWLTKMTADIKMTEEFLGNIVPELLYTFMLAIGTCIFLAMYSGPVALILVAGAILSGTIYFIVQKRLNPVLNEMRTLHASVFQLLIENLEGWRTIRSFDVLENELGRVDSRLLQFRNKGMMVARLIGSLMSANEIITHALVGVCLTVSAWAAMAGKITISEALIYPFYLGQFFFAVRGFMGGLSGVNRYRIHGRRLGEIFDIEREPKGEALEFPKGNYQLRAELTLSQGPGRLLLKQFPIEIETGKLHALVGLSGSGKSTALDALAGLRELSGSVQVLLAGHEAWSSSGANITLPVWLCSYVEQKPYLFEGTLRENLLLGRKNISDVELWNAIDQLGLSEAFGAREGLETLLSDRGQNLSEGQLYRVALARAIVSNRPFLLLDEPFAALDKESIQSVSELLRTLKKDRGILLVTHQIPDKISFDRTYQIAPRSDGSETGVSDTLNRGVQSPGNNGRAFPEKHNLLCHFQGGHDVQ